VVLTDWPPEPRGALHVVAQVLVLELDVDLLGLGQDRDRGGRGVDAPLGLGGRDPLDAVHARLPLEPREHVLALDEDDDLFPSARGPGRRRHHVALPAVPLGEPAVHAVEVGGEQRGLVAPGAGPDLEHRVLGVVGIFGQEQDLDRLLRGVALGVEGPRLVARQLAQLGVGLGRHHLAGGVEIGAQLAVPRPGPDQGLELGVLARQLAELGAASDDLGIAEQRQHFFVAAAQRRHLFVEARFVEHGAT
jgi:hypothetical protein